MRRVLPIALCFWLGLHASGRAQESDEPDVEAGKAVTEEVDSTRLDVARLPPEAIPVTRELYARGFFAEAQLGAIGFLGDLADVSKPGPRLAVSFGYEFTVWLSVLIALDASFHDTKQRPPPSQTMYEMLGAVGGLRLTLPLGARAALWVDGVAGMVWTGGDVLRGLGFREATTATLAYGGELGFDWHVFARHHSIGLLAGGRVFPDLVRDSYSMGLHGSAYLRYVF